MSQPLRIAYLDLGYSNEQYGLMPTRYGGGAVAARYLKEEGDIEFHVFAPAEAFENVGEDERRDRCVTLPNQVCEALRRGLPLDAVWQGGASQFPFDLILHPHTCETINRGSFKGPIVHFCGFDGSAGHPGNDYVLLYDPSFTPRFGERAKYVRIGKPVPPTFTATAREPFVFQCTRNDPTMNTIEVAKACLAHGIKGVFAGPIHNGYPLLDHIDGKVTHYLGEITEESKLDHCRRATLFTLAHTWDTMPFSQSVIEAQGQGCPIWATRRGPFLTTYLQPGHNGFDATQTTLVEAFERAGEISQHHCWMAARAYDTSVMISTFKQAFREIVTEWKATHS